MRNAIGLKLEPKLRNQAGERKIQTKTRIMATVGPRSTDYQALRDMVLKGATFFRLNGAHIEDDEPDQLSWDTVEKVVERIRRLRSDFRQLLGIYFDLGGPKIRALHVLSVKAKNQSGEFKERWLQPQRDEMVSICAYNPTVDHVFRRSLDQFRERQAEDRQLGDQPDRKLIDWDNQRIVERLYRQLNQTERYELMFGAEVDRVDNFIDGSVINLKDGWCRLKIERKEKDKLICKVEYVDSKFEFRPRQGASPYRHMFPEVITTKDDHDLERALRLGADIISMSFVCSFYNAHDLRICIERARRKIRNDMDFMKGQTDAYRAYLAPEHRIPIFAKIETAFAVDYAEYTKYVERTGMPALRNDGKSPIAEIIDKFDGVMVARGDLAVEVEKYKVPELQRLIIHLANLKNKPVIVATEMLESMKRGDASTRAEISDINTAVQQGADILMLSGETASPKKGQPPWAAVAEMREAIEYAEKERSVFDARSKSFENLQRAREKEIEESIEREVKGASDEARKGWERQLSLARIRLAQGSQVCLSARALETTAIMASAQTGETVREIAYYRPAQSIIAITENLLTGVRLLQYRGVYPVVMERRLTRTVDEFVDIVNQIHQEIGIPIPDGAADTFRLPSLVRVVTTSARVPIETEIPNAIQVFTLPVRREGNRERELKYLLSGASYRRLRSALKRDSRVWDFRKQENRYFGDPGDALNGARVMARLRRERVLEVGGDDAERDLVGYQRVFLTFKGPGQTTDQLGEEERPEQEFDVTREWLAEHTDVPDLDSLPAPDLNALPEFYRQYVVERWGMQIGLDGSDGPLKYVLRAEMTNHRLTAEMNNGVCFELDEAVFREGEREIRHYELEVERSGTASWILLDEYIHDKLARLNIPIVLIPYYPSKARRALAYAGELNQDDREAVRAEVEAAGPRLGREHYGECQRCADDPEDGGRAAGR